MPTTQSPGQIPAITTPLADKNGLIKNPWYFYLKKLASQSAANVGTFVTDGSADTFGPTTIYQGVSSQMGAGSTGDIFFANDTGIVYVNIGGAWIPLIPAFTGDLSSTAGSNVLTLNTVNPIYVGTFTNATITVNEKGLVTSASNGSASGGGAAGDPGSIQFAGVAGTFDANGESFSYFNLALNPTLVFGNSTLGTANSSTPAVLHFVSDVAANNSGTPQYSKITADSGLDITGQEGLTLKSITGNLKLFDGTGFGTNKFVLTSNGSVATWQAVPAAGSNGNLQFNNGGILGGISTVNFDGTSLSITTGILDNTASAGTAGQYLASSGSASVGPVWTSIPTPTLTYKQIAVGDASNLLSSTNHFTWDETTQTLNLGKSGVTTSSIIATGATGTADGINLLLRGQSGIAGDAQGGSVQVIGGDGVGNGYGGGFGMIGGNGSGAGNGGSFFLQGGSSVGASSTGNGGEVNIDAGAAGSLAGNGGHINIEAGIANNNGGNGGHIEIRAGNYAGGVAGNGGDILIRSGQSNVGGNSGSIFIRIGTPSAVLAGSINLEGETNITDELNLTTSGKAISIKEGSNARMGLATLVAGTVTVSNTTVTANSRIFLTYQSISGISVPGSIAITARTPGTNFTISSASILDTSSVAWIIYEPL